MSEFRHHDQVKQDIEGDRAMLKEDLMKSQHKVSVLEADTRTMAEKMAAALEDLKKAESEEQRRLDLYKEHYHKDLHRIHSILTNQTIELESDSAYDLQKAYNDELKKIQTSVDEIMVRDRKKMEEADDENRKDIDVVHDTLTRDVGLLKDFQNKISTGIQAAKDSETEGTENLMTGQKELKDKLSGLMTSLDKGNQRESELMTKSENNQALLKNLQDSLSRASNTLASLGQKEDREHQLLEQHLDAVKQSEAELEEQLQQQLGKVTALDEQVQAFAKKDPEFHKEVEADHAALRDTIAQLQTEIDKAQVIKGDMATMQSAMDGQIDGLLTKVDGLASTQSVQGAAGKQQETDISSLETRIGQLEASAKAASKEAKADHDDVANTLKEMEGKLGGLVSLKGDISAMDSKVEGRVAEIEADLAKLQAAHNQTRMDAEAKITTLENKLQDQIDTTGQSYANMTTTMSQMSGGLHELEAFKEESTKQDTELVHEMTDTTQSLGILDSKFSGKNVDIESRIAGLEGEIAKVPTREEFAGKISAAAATADQAEAGLKTIKDTMSGMQDKQTSNEEALNKLAGDVDAASKETSDSWKDVKAKLSGEGDLFVFIANKLKDTDLQHQVATVFERSEAK